MAAVGLRRLWRSGRPPWGGGSAPFSREWGWADRAGSRGLGRESGSGGGGQGCWLQPSPEGLNPEALSVAPNEVGPASQ